MFKRKKSYLNLEKQELDRKKFKKVFLDQKVSKQSKPWIDELFPPNENSLLGRKKNGEYLDPNEVKVIGPLMNPKGIEWKRVRDLVQDPMLFEDKISIDSLSLGEIANTYFLSTLSALSQFPNLISQIFITKKINQECIYQISLFIDGEFQIVYIDDFIPVLKGTSTPFFTKTNSFELWGLLLEKAWAKINGGYLNIVSCSLADLFRALTGFSCQTINTKEEDMSNIWNIMKDAFNNKWVMCGTVRGDEPKAKKHGLVNGSTYNILFGEDIYDNSNKKQILIKMKNAWGANVWSGDYSEGSNAWTENIIEQIGLNRINKNSEGEFWMSLKDLCKYFETIDIFQIVFGAKTYNFNYKGTNLSLPQMYNIYLKDAGILSISAYEKKWRYNRELKGIIHPTSLILGEYDPESKEIKKIYSNFSCDNDTEIAYKVNGGYYVLWIYKPNDLFKSKKPDFLKIRISSDEDISVKYIGPDSDFLGISDIISRNVRYKNKSKIKKEEFFYDIQNSLDKSGIAYRLVLNDTSDLYEDWDNDASSVEGIYLLPPYNKSKKFLFRVAPNSYCTVLGIQKEEYGTHWFNLKSKISQLPIDSLKGEEISNQMANPNLIYTTDFDNMNQPDYITTSYDVSTEQAKFPIGKYHKNLHVNKLKTNYNRLMNAYSKSFPSEMKNNKLVPTEIKKGELTFFGESNPKTKEGRGVFYDTKNDLILVTTWKDQDESSFGQIYNKLGNLIYEGEMVNGVSHGKGTFFFPGGEKYSGNFENGVIEGNGIFFWEDGSRWEGTFSNNKLHGDGVFYNPKTKSTFNASYKNNKLIEESNSQYGSMRKNRGERENIYRREKDRDSYVENDSYRDSYKEKDNFRKEGGERENNRRVLIRGRGIARNLRGKGEKGGERGGERGQRIQRVERFEKGNRNININNINMNTDMDIDMEGDIDREIREKHIDKDDIEKDYFDRDEILFDNEEKSFEKERNNKRIGGRILRFKKKEIFREKNQREYIREKPKEIERDSFGNENNEDEDEKVSDKEEEEDSQNENEIENNREIGKKFRTFERENNSRYNRFNNRSNIKREKYQKYQNKKESDEEESYE